MTEVEQAFYKALQALESEQEKAFEALREESEQREVAFSKAVSGLLERVNRLNEHNEQLSAQVDSLSTQISTLARLLKL